MMMNDEEIKELHKLMEEYCFSKNWKTSQVLAALTTMFYGTCAMNLMTDEFFDETCDRMKVKFREKKQEFIKSLVLISKPSA